MPPTLAEPGGRGNGRVNGRAKAPPTREATPVRAVAGIDYTHPDVWSGLAHALASSHRPVPGDYCGHVTCEAGWSWQITMPDYDLWLVTSGRGRLVMDGRETPLRAGSLLVLRPGDSGACYQDADNPFTVTYAHFHFVRPGSDQSVEVPPTWLPARHVRLQDVRAVQEPLLQLIRLKEQHDAFADFEAGLQLTQALVETYHQEAASLGLDARRIDSRVQQVIQHVRSHPAERRSLRDLATAVGLSTAHLRRLFSRELGISYRSFVTRSRMERARFLLEGTPMPVGAVARALGYSDVVLFSHQFRKHYGLPPSRVRRRGAGL